MKMKIKKKKRERRGGKERRGEEGRRGNDFILIVFDFDFFLNGKEWNGLMGEERIGLNKRMDSNKRMDLNKRTSR